jgi:hypothetical protein
VRDLVPAPQQADGPHAVLPARSGMAAPFAVMGMTEHCGLVEPPAFGLFSARRPARRVPAMAP